MRTHRRAVAFIAALLAAGVIADRAHAQNRTPPYWASISSAEARMRVGPSLDYPSNWVYQRRHLPVRVIQILGNWRKIADPSGTEGWMHVRLLSDAATAIVTADQAPMHAKPVVGSATVFRAQKGVVGRVNECAKGWCLFDVSGRRGYVEVDALWGAVR